MSVPQNKGELLEAIVSTFGKLIKELHNVPLSMVDESSMEGHAKGAQMSVADLAAYLVGWNEQGRFAQEVLCDYEGVFYTQFIERLEAVKNRIVSLIEARSNNDLYGHPWYEKWIMERMFSSIHHRPMTMHAVGCGSG